MIAHAVDVSFDSCAKIAVSASSKLLLSCASDAGLPVMGGEREREKMNIISELSCSQCTGPWNLLSLQPQAN